MKKFARILALIMALTMVCVTFAACGDKSAAIKKAFEKEEWDVKSVKADSDEAEAVFTLMGMDEEQIEKAKDYEIISVSTGKLLSYKSALIIKCSSAKDVKDFFTVEDKDGKKDTSAYDEAKEEGFINGNCIILTLSDDAVEIFKNA